MLLLQMRQAALDGGDTAAFRRFVESVPEPHRPLMAPALDMQAGILGLTALEMRSPRDEPANSLIYEPSAEDVLESEIFTSDEGLLVAQLVQTDTRRVVHQPSARLKASSKGLQVRLFHIARAPGSAALTTFQALATAAFGVEFQPWHYSSGRFDELRAEGRQSPAAPTETDVSAARALMDRPTRTVALAVKASGGLLVGDMAKQLPAEARERSADIRTSLEHHGLVDREVVVVCKKSQQQTARLPSTDAVRRATELGVKCACGRALGDERVEEAYSISARGRTLLDGSSWFSLLLIDKLQRLGLPLEHILVDQQVGGDEMDCIANVSGELVFFELKDKDFNLGSAYSFGAKIGIIRPEYPVVVTTETVGGDAKEHFQRAEAGERWAARRAYYPDLYGSEPTTRVRYIEGAEGFEAGVEALVTDIFTRDALRIVRQVITAMAPTAQSVLTSIEEARSVVAPSKRGATALLGKAVAAEIATPDAIVPVPQRGTE